MSHKNYLLKLVMKQTYMNVLRIQYAMNNGTKLNSKLRNKAT